MKKRKLIFSLLIACVLTVTLSVGITVAKYIETLQGTPFNLTINEHSYYTYAVLDNETKALSIRNRKAVIASGSDLDKDANKTYLVDKDGTYELGDNGVVYALPYQQDPNNIWAELDDIRIATGEVPAGAIGKNKDDNAGWKTAHNNLGSLEDIVTSVTFEDTVYLQGNLAQMFQQWSNLTSVNLLNADFSAVTSIRKLFDTCANLTNIQFSPNIDTSNVTNMSGMFYELTSLETVDVSHFNTSKVTTMWQMFYYSSKIKSLDLSGWDTSKVENMGHMFSGCSGLEELDVSKFNTSEVTNMEHMFNFCKSLKALDVSKFDTSEVTFMISMFQMCNKIEYLDLRNFDTSGISNMGALFNGCNSLNTLLWDTEKFVTSNVSSFTNMFKGCSSLTELDLSHFNTEKATSMESMFEGCSKLTGETLKIGSFNTAKVTTMKKMFQTCSSLGDLDLSHFDTSSLTDAQEMFNTSGVTTLDLRNFDTDQATNLSQMFQNCQKLTAIYVSDKFVVSAGTYTGMMFRMCPALKGGNGTTVSSIQATGVSVEDSWTGTYAIIDGIIINGESSPGYFTATPHEHNVTTWTDNGDDKHIGFCSVYNEPVTEEHTYIDGRCSLCGDTIYTLVYDANGAENVLTNVVSDSATVQINANTIPTRDGYIFIGYDTDYNVAVSSVTYKYTGDGFSQDYVFSETANTVTLYAIWSNTSITFGFEEYSSELSDFSAIEGMTWALG